MKKFYLLIFILAFIHLAIGQISLPATFNIASGTYALSSWDSLAAAGTYPANMIFHYTIQPENSATHVYDSSADGARDYTCSYNLKSRNRVLGLGQNGFAFISTSSAQYNDCIGTVSTADTTRFVGAAILALNTTGKTNIGVKWNGTIVLLGDGNGDTTLRRQYTVRLQYRIGATGHYVDAINNGLPVECSSINRVVGSTISLAAVLPATCNNQPAVYLRWVYFSAVRGGSGTRPEIAVDDIQVGSGLLPLHLLSFDVSNNNGVATLSWKTVNEINFSHFELERSIDALSYSTILSVASQSKTGINNYSVADAKPGSGRNYYRLKMIDKDGSYSYSDVVVFTANKANQLTLYPNPVADHFVLTHPQATKGAMITILSYDGKKIAASPVTENAVQTSINTALLSSGNYLILFSNGNQQMTIGFTKK